jgi:hypothetical protein
MNSFSKLQAQLEIFKEHGTLPVEEYAKLVSNKVGLVSRT